MTPPAHAAPASSGEHRSHRSLMTSIPLGPSLGKAPDGGLTAGMQSGPCCCQGLRSCPEAQGSGRFFLHPLPGWRTIELQGLRVEPLNPVVVVRFTG